jgi:SAM-dependent methyltransferase
LNKDFFDRASPDFAARRTEARKLLDSLDPAMQNGALSADPSRRAWFRAVYALAKGDPARVPWANLAAHPLSKAWVAAEAPGIAGLKVLDVGCGLGDNAECFAAVGADVTAFDFVGGAVAWAKRRFPATKISYCQGDLFALPETWRQGFDLVHECYTLQALFPVLLPQALAALGSLLAPGGRLLIIARARDEACETKSPPWPLPPSVFEEAKRQGLESVSVEDIHAAAGVAARHWRALLCRASDR